MAEVDKCLTLRHASTFSEGFEPTVCSGDAKPVVCVNNEDMQVCCLLCPRSDKSYLVTHNCKLNISSLHSSNAFTSHFILIIMAD